MKRIVQQGDRVTVEFNKTGSKQAFIVGTMQCPDKTPPEYDAKNPWVIAVLGKAVGDTVTLSVPEENVADATIIEAVIPEPVE